MPGPAPTTRPSATNNPRYSFIQQVAQATGLQPGVVAAWVRAESGAQGSGAYGGFNYLNLTAKGSAGWSGVPITGSYASNGGTGNFATFGSVDDAAAETAWWIQHMSNYSGIRATAGKPAPVQLAAIARSPWDAGHYGGNGQNLVGAYNAESKNPIAGVVSAVVHPVRTVQHAEQAVVGTVFQGVIYVVMLVGGLALIFMGVRRVSGDRLPSSTDIARLVGTTAAKAAV